MDSREEPTRPASEAMLTNRPQPRSTMPPSTARVTRMGPARLTARTFSRNSSSVSSRGRRRSQPAQFTQMSMGPRASVVLLTAASTDAGSVTSRATPMALPMPPAPPVTKATLSLMSSPLSSSSLFSPGLEHRKAPDCRSPLDPTWVGSGPLFPGPPASRSPLSAPLGLAQVGQALRQGSERPSPVGERILLLRPHLGKGATAAPGGNEHRVVAEPSPAPSLGGNGALDPALGQDLSPAPTGPGHQGHRPEGRPPVSHPLQGPEQLVHVLGVGGVLAGVVGRVDAGGAPQGHHL